MSAGATTSTDVLALHTLRCIGYSHLERVAAASGLCTLDAESELIDLAATAIAEDLSLFTTNPIDFRRHGRSLGCCCVDTAILAHDTTTVGDSLTGQWK